MQEHLGGEIFACPKGSARFAAYCMLQSKMQCNQHMLTLHQSDQVAASARKIPTCSNDEAIYHSHRTLRSMLSIASLHSVLTWFLTLKYNNGHVFCLSADVSEHGLRHALYTCFQAHMHWR